MIHIRSVIKAVRISWYYCFNAFFSVTEFTDYFNWLVFPHCIVVLVSYIIIIIIKMQDLEWHIIMSIIAGALYILLYTYALL